jgi:hypothetical protein
VAAKGRDSYTGEALDWSLISKYDNQGSKSGRRAYKQGFALLPTVDHLDEGLGTPRVAICAWRTNDCKSDLTREEFLALCRAVVQYADGTST